jgi:hypothetical protein
MQASDFLSVDPTPVNLLPSFDVPFWLSGTHFQTKRKMDAGMLCVFPDPLSPALSSFC